MSYPLMIKDFEMALRALLAHHFPYGSTEHHYVHSTPVGVSNEGFVEWAKKLFRRKKDRIKESDVDTHSVKTEAWEWLTQVLAKHPIKALTLKPGTVEVSSRYAAFFTRNGKPVTDPVAELQKDLREYRQLLARYKTKLQAAGKFLQKVERELDAFNARDTDDLENQEELEKILEKLVRECPPSLVAGFQEPQHKFLGFASVPFLEKEDGRLVFATAERPDKVAGFTLTVDSEEQIEKFLTELKEAFSLSVEIMNLTEQVGVGVDVSDPPLRGYYNELPEKLISQMRFIYPTFDEEITGLAWQLDSRISWLVEAMAVVGRKWTGA